jgi:hypothetical protein
VVFEAVKERSIACPMSLCFVQYNHIHAGERVLMQAERFSHYALYSISPTARRQFFLEIANPSLASPPSRARHKTVKSLSRLRPALLKTLLYAFSSSKRDARRKRWLRFSAEICARLYVVVVVVVAATV